MAPMMRSGSRASATDWGNSASSDSWDQSSSQAKKRRNARRWPVPVLSNRPAQHRVARLQSIEDATDGDGRGHFKRNLCAHPCQRPQMIRQNHANHRRSRRVLSGPVSLISDPCHASVCTSTLKTAGKSCTIGVHVSPAFADPYTWPPVVPK